MASLSAYDEAQEVQRLAWEQWESQPQDRMAERLSLDYARQILNQTKRLYVFLAPRAIVITDDTDLRAQLVKLGCSLQAGPFSMEPYSKPDDRRWYDMSIPPWYLGVAYEIAQERENKKVAKAAGAAAVTEFKPDLKVLAAT